MSQLFARKNSKPLALRTFSTALFSLLILTAVAAGSSRPVSAGSTIFTKCWEYEVNPNLNVGIAADASTVFFLDDENRLHGVDLEAGRKAWSSELGGEVASNLFVLGDSVFIVTNSQPDASNPAVKATFRAISRETGVTNWSVEIPSSPFVWIGSNIGNVIAVGSDGSVSAWTQAGGMLVWTTDLKSRVTAAPFFQDNGIEVATNKNEVLNLSGSEGKIRLDWKSPYLPTAILRDLNDRLLVGDERGNVIVISADGHRLWRFRNGAQISSASLQDSEYLAASYDNFVYKLSRSGSVRWKRRLSGRVNEGPLVLGGSAVISIVGTGSVYVLDLKNGKISNRIEMGDNVTPRVAAATEGQGFAVAGPHGISYFSSSKCTPE